ncbi:MAG: hypothetical protein BYD32DRAFT_460834 [Podila humilis]|nr:MAG: hypothetical protein BYD32DRAFT_460834 [Podila humilis]
MLIKLLLTFSVTLIMLGSAQAACSQGCRQDSPFSNVKLQGYLYTNVWKGMMSTALFEWTFTDINYEGKIKYYANLISESKTRCSDDGMFCIADRIAKGSESKLGYTLYYGQQCSNYWAKFSVRGLIVSASSNVLPNIHKQSVVDNELDFSARGAGGSNFDAVSNRGNVGNRGNSYSPPIQKFIEKVEEPKE